MTMKKICYSVYTKIAAVILFAACFAFPAGIISKTIADISNDGNFLYKFESSFERSHLITNKLNMPKRAVRAAYSEFYETGEDKTDRTELYKLIGENLDNMDRNVEYYVSVGNEEVFTNCGATGKGDFENRKNFYVLERKSDTADGTYTASSDSNIDMYGDLFEGRSQIPAENNTVTICAGINDKYAAECEALWNSQAQMVKSVFYKVFIFLIFALLIGAYLTGVCGKDEEENQKIIWIDRFFTEAHLFIIGAAILACGAADVALVGGMVNGYLPEYMPVCISAAATVAAALIVLNSYLSLVRNIKCRQLIKMSFLYKFANWVIRLAKKIIAAIKSVIERITGLKGGRTGAVLIGMLLAYTALICVCGIVMPKGFIPFIISCAAFIFAAFVLDNRAKDVEEIKRGVSEIRNGNTAYKIPELKCSDLVEVGVNINEMGEGMVKSLESMLKAERMKTELIANVSHDLKTPLTSVINYAKLLEDMENLPEEARDYVKIISKKSERLKNLTRDLFDISKVQSGNEEILREKIDLVLLINQSMGEYDSEIKKSGLIFVMNMPKELFIVADGRKMSRVIGNLIENILKYTLKNTRVFILGYEENKTVCAEFKNISSYPMDFDNEDITERFVRGDKSRSAEGNGLGLAIAKSYVEACGGDFIIKTDGDMFKAVIKFDSFEE